MPWSIGGILSSLDPRPDLVCTECGALGKPTATDGARYLADSGYMISCSRDDCSGVMHVADAALASSWEARAEVEREKTPRAAAAAAAASPSGGGRSVLIVGSAGCVGGGIAAAFARGATARDAAWDRVALCDPRQKPLATDDTTAGVQTLAMTFEAIDDVELASIAAAPRSVLIIVADDGDRANYVAVTADDGSCAVADANAARFEQWMGRIASMEEGARFAHIVVIGGSWTKRAVSADDGWIVRDTTLNKARSDANPYEIAKIEIEERCAALCEALPTLPPTTFVDQISVVPNFSPNFSIASMVATAMSSEKGHTIRFSEGPFGRAVAARADTGFAVRLLCAHAVHTAVDSTDAPPLPPLQRFTRRLIPGVFIRFAEWAEISKAAVERSGAVEANSVVFEPYPEGGTPDFLRATTESVFFRDVVGWTPCIDAARAALVETADAAVARHLDGDGAAR